MHNLLISFSSNSDEIFSYLESSKDLEYEVFTRERLDGNTILSVAITFSTTAFLSLSKVLIEYIKSKKITSIEYKGFKVDNLSEDKALLLLNEISKKIDEEKTNEKNTE